MVPPELISLFNEKELELLISGLPDIDLDDLQANTEYTNWRASDRNIEWFWTVLREFTKEEKANFLQFVSGTSKVPIGGFAQLQGMRGVQRFNIHRAYGGQGLLPAAHTCFNQLDLPEYKSDFPHYDPVPLASIAPKLCADGLDLLTQMLRYEPAQRVSAKAAMSHPYFKELDQTRFKAA